MRKTSLSFQSLRKFKGFRSCEPEMSYKDQKYIFLIISKYILYINHSKIS